MSCLCSLRKLSKLLPASSLPPLNNASLLQIVRWRKPRWVPVAKSKMFRVRVTSKEPSEGYDHDEYLNQYNHYRTAMKTIRYFLTQWQNEIKTESVGEDEVRRMEEEEHRSLMEVNCRWNSEIALARAQRQFLEDKSQVEKLEQRRLEKEIEERIMTEEARRYIQQEMTQAKRFITPENLDEEIGKVLNMRTDYNFAIDEDGNKIFKNKPKSDSDEKAEQPA